MFEKRKITHILWQVIPLISFAMWFVFCISPNLSYDEAYTAGLISRSFSDILDITAADVHPPVYYVLARGFYLLCGGGTAYNSLKIFSLLFAFGYMLIGKYYVRKLYDETVSVYFMLISVLTPIMLTQVGNARMYTYALFFMTASNLLAIDLLRQTNTKKYILFALTSIVTVYTHTYTMLQLVVLYVILLGIFASKKQFVQMKRLVFVGVLVSISYMPWLRVTYLQMTARVADTSGGVVRNLADIKELVKGYKNEWFSMLEMPNISSTRILLVIVVVMCIFSLWTIYQKKLYTVLMGIVAILVTVLLGTMLSIYMGQGFLIRYVFSGLGAYALFLAVGLSHIKPIYVRGVMIASLIPFMFTHYMDEYRLEYTDGLSEYKAYVDTYVGEEDAVIGPTEHTIFLSVYYPQIQHFIYGYKPEFLPFENVDAFREWSQFEHADTIWFLCFADRDPSVFQDYYSYEQVLRFEHMNYAFKLYKLTPLSTI